MRCWSCPKLLHVSSPKVQSKNLLKTAQPDSPSSSKLTAIFPSGTPSGILFGRLRVRWVIWLIKDFIQDLSSTSSALPSLPFLTTHPHLVPVFFCCAGAFAFLAILGRSSFNSSRAAVYLSILHFCLHFEGSSARTGVRKRFMKVSQIVCTFS